MNFIFAPMSQTNRSKLLLVFKGMAMGIAEVIPGVSGGTIAFITNIYERLLNSIKSIDKEFVRKVLKFKLLDAWRHIDGPQFLFFLLLGMGAGLVSGVFGITHLLEKYPEELWGFFFGLIIASAIYIGGKVEKWNALRVVTLMVGIAFAFTVTMLAPSQGSTSLFYVFCCGAIAISALILPGISGSFILLLMGMYAVVIQALKRLLSAFNFDDLTLIAVFACGCIIGLLTFARLMSWLFKTHGDQTLAILTGVMLGSLNKIWPWRIAQSWVDDAGNILTSAPALLDEVKVLSEQNVLPTNYPTDPNTLVVLLCAVLGFSIVFVLERVVPAKS